ncbi:hypothetical protein CLAFUW4_02407 [Fulvia fulva]|uniref:Uncharacterized protein n=1 Tax=Passalora fulva TaxID=5499 RepID=A0A9Q8L934_PASFU|nr:uncharacterized protein CLAFUR5_02395 [Fulvia fulva]KAK4631303.1 hypothetical protein CLAFUR4_02402 [Fulvia fulva]KAK4633954.1 hypothetical protein CLAFUR0_02406 [Fulvia fulva]UJO13191.1 hypothetical protein CLAFUR5_02395 [Fulvia fulva]WPV11539.1 hypothetical protein CLAFUW4_02407 [Fulvia fulva]WPV26404.1 hypothetical protein CLAFUW7_02407 [Fulvia fulva]
MLVAAHSTYYKCKEEDLLTKLGRCSELDCAEPRDRLYPLIGMDTSLSIVPDYSFSTAQAYTQLGKAMWEAGEGVCASDNLQYHRRASQAIGLPSWVPDLRFGFNRSQHVAAADLGGKVDQNNVLTYSPHRIGQVIKVSDHSHFVLETMTFEEDLEFFLKYTQSISKRLPLST